MWDLSSDNSRVGNQQKQLQPRDCIPVSPPLCSCQMGRGDGRGDGVKLRVAAARLVPHPEFQRAPSQQAKSLPESPPFLPVFGLQCGSSPGRGSTATPRHAEPRRATPSHAEPRRATPSHAEPRRATPSHATQSHSEPHGADQGEDIGRAVARKGLLNICVYPLAKTSRLYLPQSNRPRAERSRER
ncbi:hypothetical protein EYF80_009471 [Liparis tanakae]|uniref:Uncharacterized protein n=1 Tax=Liparis tanakae TaxID=230148 RepID=A0A4Z2IRQ0_9TELE|nr:hypothetical protein EYF80_009471 [Liparis tanakae]